MTKILILDGSSAADPTGKRMVLALTKEMQSQGWQVEHLVLRDKKIGNCAGDFFCWIRTPGMCVVNDDNRAIAQAVIHCDLMVFLTPVTFGGYSSDLRRAVDRLTQNNLPFFMGTDGEIHHQPRYLRNPKLLAIGWLDAPEEVEESIFHTLVRRNATNMHFPNSVSGLVLSTHSDGEVAKAVQGWLKNIQAAVSLPSKASLRRAVNQFREHAIRSALLLVGSPRGKKSTSGALGGYLYEQLDAKDVQTKTVYLYPALNSPDGIQSLLEAVEAHDLIILASPLYIDSLPAPVTRALELIAAHCAERPEPHAFSAIINSGFPEAKQSETALAICAAFAQRAGFTWAGGLALGGGAGVVHGTPLTKLGWRARSIRKSLELTASSLAAGNPISDEAVRLMGKTRIPTWLLFAASRIGWKQKSRKFGAENALRRQPYLMD